MITAPLDYNTKLFKGIACGAFKGSSRQQTSFFHRCSLLLLLIHCCPYLALLLLQAPVKDSKQLFLQYAALEETYGLARSAMEVYDKAVRTVVDKERYDVYTLYLARATQFFGVGKVKFDAASS